MRPPFAPPQALAARVPAPVARCGAWCPGGPHPRSVAGAHHCREAVARAHDAPSMATVHPETPDPARAEPEPAAKKLKFPTAFTVLAAVLLLVWVASFFVPAGAYKLDQETAGPVPGTYHELPSCSDAKGDELCVETAFDQRFKQLWIAPPNGLYGIENDRGFVERRRAGLPVRLGDDLPVRARGRRVHHRDDEDRSDPDRDRAAGAALPPQRLGPDRDPDGRLRARRDDLRDVGGDARLLRPARPADARARLRPHGRRLDHLPRRRHGRALLDRQPVRDRRRLRRRGHQPRRRHRPADRHVGRARRDGDRLRAALRAPASARTRRGRSSASRRRDAAGRAEPDRGRAQARPAARSSSSCSSSARSSS